MKRSWIKLYLEILDDDKFGELPEFQKWRAIELFLVAGENGDDGLLPPVARLAWRLRLDEVKLAETLSALTEVGVVHETPEGWVVTHFRKRQERIEGAERTRLYRERLRECDETSQKSHKECDVDVSLPLNLNLPLNSVSSSDSIFESHFRSFNGDREKKRWRTLVEAVGEERAKEIADWAERKEVHMTNRGGLMDSLETAAKKWNEPGKKNGSNHGKSVEDNVAAFMGSKT